MLRRLPLYLPIAATAGLFASLIWCTRTPDSRAPAASTPAATPNNSPSASAPQDETTRQRLALFFGKDDREFIAPLYASPFAAIGRLETVAGSTCTATLVSDTLAVTAAHCFLMEPRKIDNGKWFLAGYHAGQYGAKYAVKGQVFHPRFQKGLRYKGEDVYIDPSAAAYDIAWLKLEKVEGIAPQPLALLDPKLDTLKTAFNSTQWRVTQAGYAEDHDDKLTAHRHCLVTQLRDNHTLYHQCDTLAGDSGSPLFIATTQGPRVIAVQSSAPDWFNRGVADNVAVTVLQLPKPPQ
ncbi:trypsin-like serine peptidase [Chitinilyticum piscinae]|uniref:Trypsin-like serine protease n=1 Tax=Chitinilyticum piscinae TaxID=2866724 RepID=A0A8J7K9A6_9NEIS|nr:trypsin-like serine protease [Chitinilyticum piscinae]MBE9607789.1 trypsin-like serine protease [Chitinilyticum piscinae]